MKPPSVPLKGEMGETAEAAALASAFYESIHRFAMALSRYDKEEALEIVQQTYMEVLEARTNLLSARDPKSYLFGVARRVAASRRRRRSIWGRILRLELAATKESGGASDPEDCASLLEQTSAVRKAMAKLPHRQLEILCLVFGEEMTVEGAAEVMKVSVGSARTHYHRAKAKIAESIGEEE